MQRQKAHKKTDRDPPRAAAPRGRYHKISDVCAMTDTQPYVLRFWESEFPQLAPAKSRSGHRIYTDKDIELVRKIKTLLYEAEYTIAGARRKLEEEGFTLPEAPSHPPAPARSSAHAEEGERSGRKAREKFRSELLAIKEMLES